MVAYCVAQGLQGPHRAQLNKIESLPELQRLLDGDKRLVEDFLEYARRKGVEPNPREIARSRHLVEAQLRAYIGRNTQLEDNAFYLNIYPIDNVLTTAVEVLNQALKESPAGPTQSVAPNSKSVPEGWKREKTETIELKND